MTSFANLKPMAQRLREADEIAKARLAPEIYASLRDNMRAHKAVLVITAQMLGRENWDLLWGVYRDSIELSVERLLTARENLPRDKKGIVG
jgi:hypothetical protein